ncbi:hypothetical protein LPJ56_002804, partial [Coemansia sp. RSA 2599]
MPLDSLKPVPIRPATQCRLLRQLENDNLLSLNMYEETAASLSDLQNNNNNNDDGNGNDVADEAAADTLGPRILQAIRRKNLVSKRFYDICDPGTAGNTTQGDFFATRGNSGIILGRVVSNSVGTIYSVLARAGGDGDGKG